MGRCSIRKRCRSLHSTKTSSTLLYHATIVTALLIPLAAAFSPSPSGVVCVRPMYKTKTPSPLTTSAAVTTSTRSTKLHNLFPKDDFERDDFLDDDEDDNDGIDTSNFDPALAAQIRKAKQLLNDAKKKQKSKEEAAAKAAARAEAAAEMNDGAPPPPSPEPDMGTALPFFATKSFTASAAQTSQKIKSKRSNGEIIADGETMASLSKSEPWEKRSLAQMFEKEARMDYDGNLVDPNASSSGLDDKDVARSIYNLRKRLQNDDFRRVFDDKNRFIGEVE